MYTTQDFKNVATLSRMMIADLRNTFGIVELADKRFEDYMDENKNQNLGSTVNFQLQPQLTSSVGLVAVPQGVTQQFATLTLDQSSHVALQLTAQDLAFYAKRVIDSGTFYDDLMRQAAATLGSYIEANLAKNFTGSVPVFQQVGPDSVPTGDYYVENSPMRFADFTTTPLTTFVQLSTMLAQFTLLGTNSSITNCVLPPTTYPQIVNNGLTQFAPKRNDELARNWEIGEQMGTRFIYSNLLPLHTAGVIGQTSPAPTLTVVSTSGGTTNGNPYIDTVVFSVSGSPGTGAIKAGDCIYMVTTNSYWVNRTGKQQSPLKTQMIAAADADESGGQVTVTLAHKLYYQSGTALQNISARPIAGETAKVVGSHVAGCVWFPSFLKFCVANLPTQDPFLSTRVLDEESGIKLNTAAGAMLGANQNLSMMYAAWGTSLTGYGAMRICLPVS